jgi:hypothetical protein
MVKKSLVAVAVMATALVGAAAPAGATSSRSTTQAVAAPTHAARSSAPQKAGQLDWSLDGFQCTSSGGSLGHGFIGARGYMDELGATNVTKMAITITAQQKFTTKPIWRTVAGSAATYTYNFAGSANSASHTLTGPRPGLLWSYNYSATDDANNYIYRMNLKFVWTNATSRVTHSIATKACFSN